MIEKVKRIYPIGCILLFVSSFLLLFTGQRFVADMEFLFTVLTQTVIAKHIGFFGNFWNAFTGCGVPFFPQPWSKFCLMLNIFFQFFDLKTAYLFFLICDFIIAYFAFYYLARYFFKERYIATFLSLLYISSGMLYGYFTTNYLYVEYFMIGPLMIVILHKYIEKKNILYLVLLAILNIYTNLGLNIIGIATIYFLLNLFIIVFIYEKYKRISKIIYYLFVINIVLITTNLFKIISTLQYYFSEGARLPLSYLTGGLLSYFVCPLNFLFLSGHFPINIHYLSFFLLMSYFFYSKNSVEKASFMVFIFFIGIIYISYAILFILDINFVKSLSLYKILWGAHIPGTLMLGTGVRAFICSADKKKEYKAFILFAVLWISLFLLYAVKKHSFNIEIIENIKWPLIFGLTFFLFIFISKNIKVRKICAIVIILIYGMFFIHNSDSNWQTDNTYQNTYLSNLNGEILQTLGVESHNNFIHEKIGDIYRIIGYKDKNPGILDYIGKEIPFFSIGNYPMLFGVSSVHNHENVFLKRYAAFIKILETSEDIKRQEIDGNVLLSPLFPLLNVKYLFTYDDIDIKEFSLHKKLSDGKTKIYKNNNLLPRIFAVGDFIPYKSEEDFIKILNERNVNFAKTVLIGDYTQDINKYAEIIDYKINSIRYENDLIKIDLNTSSSCFLVVLDNYYPGWKAYINGKETRIHPAYMTFRTIYLPQAGSYQIEFRYRPTFFKVGILIAMAVFAFLFLMLFNRNRKNYKKA